MTRLSPQVADQIIKSCQANETAIADALETALEGKLTVEAGAAEQVDSADSPSDLKRPGLFVVFRIGDTPLVGLLSAPFELLRDWCGEKDTADADKLADLAARLGEAILPESIQADAARAEVTDNLAEALSNESLGDPVTRFAVSIAWNSEKDDPSEEEGARHPSSSPGGTQTGTLILAWEATKANDEDAENGGDATLQNQHAEEPGSRVQPVESTRPSPIQASSLEEGLEQLPAYSKSLLKIRIPVTVTLANSRVSLSRVLELGHGSILQFNKSCEESLTLEASDQVVAEGEAVKVGDKFGLWITAISLPEERFWVLGGGNPLRVK